MTGTYALSRFGGDGLTIDDGSAASRTLRGALSCSPPRLESVSPLTVIVRWQVELGGDVERATSPTARAPDVGCREFVPVEAGAPSIAISIRQITWDGPYTPICTWSLVRGVDQGAEAASVEAAVQEILESQEYFRICGTCLARNPGGWMHDAEICQGCAVRTCGVVY